ncbi:hypothetical protein CC85DRAFT_330437 [Cutaneotrichosporon oleaginosum]|uniref:Uncharacterized protein n=1 Tax=Cutaneotrichosporon oleaginosum TaxID=879819 RepID=A0A0J0XFJ3_9TREE|nr:uncharacterized protein CC85DRAFT_330437 [Cutaneotrichosporon oleaginosum]KLT39826.1 hypothetical protein CC85DRAFT_330437 [Cutaneotrichosporon oleaginosum]TXT10350.1 hypothetical protein COLE_04284 [Cutaneotrichosporon oleaginosum]
MDDLVAARYSHIPDRGKYASLSIVRRELKHVSDAPPTSLHPLERKGYLEAILGDLDPNGGAWITWPEDVHLLALNAVKVLGRNPVGSKDVLIQPDHLATLVFHTSLPAQMPGVMPLSPVASSAASSNSHSNSFGMGMAPPVSSRSIQDGRAVPPPPTSRPALEALRALANSLTLHPPARSRVSRLGVGEAVARALHDEIQPDRLFLLCRVAFLVTLSGSGAVAAVRAMVEEEGIVPRLVHHLNNTPPIEANYDNVTELLKLITNVLSHYPRGPRGSLDPRLVPLHYPVLACIYQLDMRELRPPLSTALSALVYIPFDSSNLSIWYSVPGAHPAAGGVGLTPFRSASSRPSTASSSNSGNSSPEEKKKRGLFSKKRRDSNANKPKEHLTVPERRESAIALGAEDAPRYMDIGKLPRRIIDCLNVYIELNLPGNAQPASDLQLDDALSPVLMLATHAATGSEEMRHYFRGSLLPPDLDRSPAAGPLESRPGLLGTLLRLLDSTAHVQTRDTAGEFLFALAGLEPAKLCDDVGYGNVAGFLFRKGVSGPPKAHLAALDDAGEGPVSARAPVATEPSLSGHHREQSRPNSHRTNSHTPTHRSSPQPQPPSARQLPPQSPTQLPYTQPLYAQPLPVPSRPAPAPPGPPPMAPPPPPPPHGPLPPPPGPPPPHPERNVITGLHREADGPSPFAGMSEAERDREADKLFHLFQRLETNPILKAGAPTPDGGHRSLREEMSARVAMGDGDAWERADAERERLARLAEDEADEREALAEMARYRQRRAR